MRFPNEAELKALRERYPAGTRIRLIRMADDIAPVPPGTTGSVAIIDDAGNIHMKWEPDGKRPAERKPEGTAEGKQKVRDADLADENGLHWRRVRHRKRNPDAEPYRRQRLSQLPSYVKFT